MINIKKSYRLFAVCLWCSQRPGVHSLIDSAVNCFYLRAVIACITLSAALSYSPGSLPALIEIP